MQWNYMFGAEKRLCEDAAQKGEKGKNKKATWGAYSPPFLSVGL